MPQVRVPGEDRVLQSYTHKCTILRKIKCMILCYLCVYTEQIPNTQRNRPWPWFNPPYGDSPAVLHGRTH